MKVLQRCRAKLCAEDRGRTLRAQHGIITAAQSDPVIDREVLREAMVTLADLSLINLFSRSPISAASGHRGTGRNQAAESPGRQRGVHRIGGDRRDRPL